MDDADIVECIDRLSAEEHQLEQAHIGEALSAAEVERLEQLQVALDRCWDLLRQRRARRAAGKDPSAAVQRSADVVERYQQ